MRASTWHSVTGTPGGWFERHPGSFGEALLWSLLAATCLRAFSFGTTGLDWDESFYVVVAQRWLNGGVPYADIWDIHPMGVPALFAVGAWIVGDGLFAARLLALLAVAGTAALLWLFLRRYARSGPGGVLAALFYLAYMMRPEGLAANTEIFNNLAVTAASYLLAGAFVTSTEVARTGRVFAASSLLGIGLQLKYVVFPEAVALCGALFIRQLVDGVAWRRTAALAGIALIGGLLPTVLATWYFWWAGALQPYLDATFRANVAYVAEPVAAGTILLRLRYGLLPIVGLLVWPFVLSGLSARGRLTGQTRLVCLWLTIWLIAGCVDVALPLKFWKHYFNALVPPLCLMAGLSVTLLAGRLAHREARAARWISMTAITLTLIPAIGQAVSHAPDSRDIDRPNVPRLIAERIVSQGTNGHDVYVFDYDPLVYAYAHAAPPSRFVLGVELADFAASAGTSAEAEIARILSGKPRWIVTVKPSPYRYGDVARGELERALRDYEPDARFEERDYILPPIEVSLWRRRE